jgi:hypothetical protein
VIVFFVKPKLHWRTLTLRCLSLSAITHCCPCSAGYVLDRNWKRVSIIREEVFVRANPGRLLGIAVSGPTVAFPIRSMGEYPTAGAWKKYLLGAGARWADDCVGLTAEMLAQAGIVVPARIRTPAGLFRWLRRRYAVCDLR